MERNTKVVLIAALLILGSMGVVAAADIFGTSEETVGLDAPDGPSITTVDADFESDVPIRDGEVDLGHHSFESSGTSTATVRDFDEDFLVVEAVDAPNELTIHSDRPETRLEGDADSVEFRSYAVDDGNVDLRTEMSSGQTITVTMTGLPEDEFIGVVDGQDTESVAYTGTNGVAEFEISDSGNWELQRSEDVVSNPRPEDGEIIDQQTDIDLQVDVDLAGYGEYDVVFYDASDDSEIGTDTVQDDATASVTWSQPDLGSNSWYVIVDGEFESDTWTFETPADIEIRDEETQELITEDLDIEVQFFGTDDTVVTRSTDTGQISLTGLEPAEEYVVIASSEDGYFDRRVIIEDITQQSTIYLLNETADAVEIEFIIEDNTGDFDSPDTRIFVSKPFPGPDNTTSYELLSASDVGVGGFGLQLERGQRYQIRVENEEGQTRNLGAYQPERDEQRPLEIGEIRWEIGDSMGDENRLTWHAERFEQDGTQYIRFNLNDRADLTEEVDVQIYESGNKSNMTIHDQTHFGPYGELVITEPLDSEQENVSAWVVEWEADRDGETIGAERIVGAGSYPAPIPAGGDTVALFSALLIMFVAGFFSFRVAELGVVVVPIVATGLWMMGWLPLPLSWILAALAMGVATEFATRGGFSQR